MMIDQWAPHHVMDDSYFPEPDKGRELGWGKLSHGTFFVIANSAPLQSNPIQSNPIQSNPIQSKPSKPNQPNHAMEGSHSSSQTSCSGSKSSGGYAKGRNRNERKGGKHHGSISGLSVDHG